MNGRHGHVGHAGRRRYRGAAALAAVVLAGALVAGYAGWSRAAGQGTHGTGAKAAHPASPVQSAVASMPAAPRRCTVSAILVPSCGAWWGMYLDTDPGGDGLVSAVQAQENTLGRPLDIIQRYHDMSDTGNGIFPNPAEQEIGMHHLLLFSWAPGVWASHTYYRWQTIASGQLDSSVLIPEAQRLRDYGRPVFLSFAPESDTPASIPGRGSAAEYVAAWRHLHTVFEQAGARNVIWVWTTEGFMKHVATIAAMYPGDAYVDWIGWDPYNFYTCHNNGWTPFPQTITPFYYWLMAHHFGNKPFMLPEFGTQLSGDPAQDAAWYASILSTVRALPHLKALVNWDSTVRGCQLAVSGSPSALGAFRQTGLSPYLRQRLP
jgi:Glycosyl hydrolase family 26